VQKIYDVVSLNVNCNFKALSNLFDFVWYWSLAQALNSQRKSYIQAAKMADFSSHIMQKIVAMEAHSVAGTLPPFPPYTGCLNVLCLCPQ
jgi:hypothetical protein